MRGHICERHGTWTLVYDVGKQTRSCCRACARLRQRPCLPQGDQDHRPRRISIDTRTVAALRARRREQAADRLAWPREWANRGDLVFTREDGRWLNPMQMTDGFRKFIADTALPRIRLHDLRHTHATLMLQAGVPVKVVADRLGHADVSMTLTIDELTRSELPPTISVKQVANLLHIAIAGAYRGIHDGDIPSIRVGRRYRIPTAKLLDMIGLEPTTIQLDDVRQARHAPAPAPIDALHGKPDSELTELHHGAHAHASTG